MKYFNYIDLGIVSAKKPFNTHLFWEHSTYGLILVDSGDQTKLFISTDKGDNWVEIDLSDNTNSWKIQAGWLDGVVLWLLMCDNDGTADDFEVCFIELDDSNDCNPVAVSGGTGDINTVYATDIFKIGSEMRVINWEERGGIGTMVVWDVDANPFVELDIQGQDGIENMSRGAGVVVGTKYWYVFVWDDAGTKKARLSYFEDATDTIAKFNGLDGYQLSTNFSLHGMAYDGSNILFISLKKVVDSKNYLHSYSITGDDLTSLGEYDIVLMADRNTASGVLEKAFHITEYNIYQLQVNNTQLNLIAVPATDAVIIAITDNFFMNNDGDMWEYEDQINNLQSVDIIHEIMEAPLATVTLKKDLIPIENSMVMKFYDTYTSSILPILYRGTYNFGDDANGAVPTDWTDGSGAGATATIVSSWQDHKKVLDLHVTVAGDATGYVDFSGDQITGTVEFYVGSSNTNLQTYYILRHGATNCVMLDIKVDQLRYNDGAWHNIVAIADDNIYHVKVVFDCGTNTYDLYFNGDLKGTYGFNTGVDHLDRMWCSAVSNADYHGYLDAVGFSWDADYTVGDNLIGVDQIVFEGVIFYHTDTLGQTIDLRSLAEKDVDARPSGDYSGRSDEIVTSLLNDYCSYITKGIFSVGTAMGTITFGGEKKLGTILDELAYFENWIWYLTPTGVLYFNNGTVDTLENFTEADNIHFTLPRRPHEVYNKIKVKGAYVDGVQVESEDNEGQNLESQQKTGINYRTFMFSFLNTIALCNTAANNLLTRLGKVPIVVSFVHQDVTIGFMQPGETITFEFNKGGIVVSSDQFGINEIIYIEQSVGNYDISDELL